MKNREREKKTGGENNGGNIDKRGRGSWDWR